MEVLCRVGRGKFTIGESKKFIPEISPKMKTIYNKIKKAFPFVNLCMWNTSTLNEFMIHQAGQFYLLIEVEKEAKESTFYFLKEAKHVVYIDPTSELIEKYIRHGSQAIIIKSLVSEAPTQFAKGVSTTTIEKILVDIFCDDIIFSSQQGAEMRTIFNEALNKYSVNENKMWRYAARRRKKDELTKYLSSLSNWRHKVHT